MCGALMKTVPITRFCARMTRAAICRTAAMASCCSCLLYTSPAPFVSRYFKEMNGTNLTQYIHKVRLEPVSYTHLQGLGNYTKAMMEADPNFKEDYIQAAAPVTSTKGKNAKFSKMNNIYDPVSYTHLDVYKRQPLLRDRCVF